MSAEVIGQDSPPRPVLPVIRETGGQPGYDVAPRPYCAAVVYDLEGEPMPCQFRGSMAWHGVPFCANHAPRRIPGMPGWNRL